MYFRLAKCIKSMYDITSWKGRISEIDGHPTSDERAGSQRGPFRPRTRGMCSELRREKMADSENSVTSGIAGQQTKRKYLALEPVVGGRTHLPAAQQTDGVISLP